MLETHGHSLHVPDELLLGKTTRLVANGAVVYHKYLIQDLSATKARMGQ